MVKSERQRREAMSTKTREYIIQSRQKHVRNSSLDTQSSGSPAANGDGTRQSFSSEESPGHPRNPSTSALDSEKINSLKKQIELQYEQLSKTIRDRELQSCSRDTIDRSAAAKFYLQQHVLDMQQAQEARRLRREKLEETLAQATVSEEEKDKIRKEFLSRESRYTRMVRTKLDASQFTTLKVIGRGGFAQVKLVKQKDSDQVFAMKVLRKADILEWNQVSHIRAERDILVEASEKNHWVTKLYYSFQDKDFLYLIMEYVPGGDLMSKLVEKDTFTVEETRFYIAELISAVHSIHEMNYIHRDIKPDNILIDLTGHLKLTDFGLCTGFHEEPNFELMSQNNRSSLLVEDLKEDAKLSPLEKMYNHKKSKRSLAFSTVGSPNYIAPEVLLKAGYGKECDFWSVGIIMFEMLFGYPPFSSTSDNVTYWKIVRHKDYFQFPDGFEIDSSVKSLISGLITDAKHRFTFEQIKSHPFFAGLDWDRLRDERGPFAPHLSSAIDTSYFDNLTEEDLDFSAPTGKMNPEGDLAFVGFTFKRFNQEPSPSIPKFHQRATSN